MEKEKKNNGLIVLVIILSLLVLGLGGYIFYDKVYNEEDIDTNEINNDINESDIFVDNDNTSAFDLEIKSIDSVEIIVDSPNSKLFVRGTMNLLYDEEKYFPVTLSGYCMDENNNKYSIYGPGTGAISFYNYDKNFVLVNTINSKDGDVIDSNSNMKHASEIDWNNRKITSCKIEKANAKIKDEDIWISKDLNYEYNVNN